MKRSATSDRNVNNTECSKCVKTLHPRVKARKKGSNAILVYQSAALIGNVLNQRGENALNSSSTLFPSSSVPNIIKHDFHFSVAKR